MNLDLARIQSILETPAWFYDSGRALVRNDARLNPGARTFIGTQLETSMHVLDVGCGNGETLLTYHDRFRNGVGIDIDPAHLDQAHDARRSRQIENVSFHLLDVTALHTIAAPGTFDFIFSQRGPLVPNRDTLAPVLQVLCPNGLLFCELIGNLHHQEAHALFSSSPQTDQMTTTSEQMRVVCEQNGLSIRLAADLVSKRYYPDIYAWLQFQCAIWRWLGQPLPEADDPRIGWFAERNQTQTGEIETTHHVVWVAGIKAEGHAKSSSA